MAGEIKLFSINQKYFHSVGIYQRQTNQKSSLLNLRKWIIMISLILNFLSSAAYLVFEAESTLEYGKSFHATSCFALMICNYLILMWQIENYSSFIENCEQLIAMSK